MIAKLHIGNKFVKEMKVMKSSKKYSLGNHIPVESILEFLHELLLVAYI